MPPSTFSFYNRREYFEELIQSARQARAGDRLTVMTMVFDPTETTIAKLADELAAAAKRGADVTLVIDAYSFLLSEQYKPGPLILHAKIIPDNLGGPFRIIYSSLKQLQDAGGKYCILNQPTWAFSLPIAGRSHIKLALVNNRVFIGGCNLDKPDYVDLMIAWEDCAAASKIRELVDLIIVGGSVKRALGNTDRAIPIHNDMRLFVDSGVRNQSLIMQQAHKLIDEAQKSVLITCQFFPGGRTAQRLLAAQRRGVVVTIFYSPPSSHGLQAPGQWLYNQRERLRLPAAFFSNQLSAGHARLHAKIIATESATLLGSHNYVQAGVNLGTAEIALLINDAILSETIREKVVSLVAG